MKTSKSDRFGSSFRDAVSAAAVLADEGGEKLLTPAHLLLAIVAQADPVVTGALRRMTPDIERLSRQLNRALRPPSTLIASKSSLRVLGDALMELHVNLTPEQRCDEARVLRLTREIIEKYGAVPHISEGARHICDLAEQESQSAGAETVQAEHILLGLLMDTGNEAARAMKDAGITLDLARSAVAESRRLNAHPSPPFWRTLESAVLRIVAAARNHVRCNGREVVTPGDILLALVDDDDIGRRLVLGLGIDAHALHRSVEALPSLRLLAQSRDIVPPDSSAAGVVADTGPAQPGGWLDPLSREAFEFAAHEAERLNHAKVGPAALLAGIFAVSDQEDLSTLRRAGLELQRVWEAFGADGGGPGA